MTFTQTKVYPSLRLLAAGIAASVAISSGAFAQTPTNTDAPATGQNATLERVVVTGTYIPKAESEGPLPVTTYSQETLISLGASSAAEGLRNLPSFTGNTATETDSNGGDGSATVNLRALGPENTLVLIEGRRADSYTDLNLIPFGAIDHIEVLKDGASATYGADAVGGVVNIILKKNVKGEVDFLYGNTTNNDATNIRTYALAGFSNEHFSFTVGGEYFSRLAIFSKDRFLSSQGDRTRFGGDNQGSPTFPGRLATSTLGNLTLINPGGIATSPADYRATNEAADLLNFRQFTPAIPEQERNLAWGNFSAKIFGKRLEAFGFGLYAYTDQENGLAPSPFSIGNLPGERAILQASPFNPFPTDPDPLIGNPLKSVRYRAFEVGNRQSEFIKEAYHFVVGLRGEISKDWSWETAFATDDQKETERDSNDEKRSKIIAALAAGTFNPFIGINAPRTGVANGVAYDNVAALQGAEYVAHSVTRNSTRALDFRVNGRILPDLPQGGFSIAVGVGGRWDQYRNSPDPVVLADPVTGIGDPLGFNSLPGFAAKDTVTSLFGELLVPIVTPTMNIPGIYSLDFTIAGRYEDYAFEGTDPLLLTPSKPGFTTRNPKYAFRYQPYSQLTLRGSYSTSFRAPSFTELFTAASNDFPELFDAKAPGGPAKVQPDDGVFLIGNPNLRPETTKSYTLGAVFTPKFVPGFTLTVDYYYLKQRDIVAFDAGAAQTVLDINSATGTLAEKITRDDAGTLVSVNATPFNIARRDVEGVDVTAIYEIPTDNFGKFTLSLYYNHFFKFTVTPSELSPKIDFTGTFANSTAFTPGSVPYNKGYFQAQWEYKHLTLSGQLNYIGDYQDDTNAIPPNAITGLPRTRDVREYTTFDVFGSYEFVVPKGEEVNNSYSKDGKTVVGGSTSYRPKMWQRIMGGTTLRAGIENVFDEAPPFAAGAFNDNYDTSLYNIRGRFYYVGINKKF